MITPYAPPGGVLAKFIQQFVLNDELEDWHLEYGYGHETEKPGAVYCIGYGTLNFGTDPDTDEIRLKGQVQIIVKHGDQLEAHRVSMEIAQAFAAVKIQDMTVFDFDDGAVQLQAVAHKSGPMFINHDEKDRYVFSMNVVPTIVDFNR